MKTKKLIVYVLITFFFFSPFLNIEGLAALRRLPILKTEKPEPICNEWCGWIGNEYCCTHECCEGGPDNCTTIYDFCISSPLFNLNTDPLK
jgi:hypothetical protein